MHPINQIALGGVVLALAILLAIRIVLRGQHHDQPGICRSCGKPTGDNGSECFRCWLD